MGKTGGWAIWFSLMGESPFLDDDTAEETDYTTQGGIWSACPCWVTKAVGSFRPFALLATRFAECRQSFYLRSSWMWRSDERAIGDLEHELRRESLETYGKDS